jgi:hypothetical protein
MFATDSSTQTSTISFRLKSSANTNLTVEFNGRDIRVADLKDKIAERLLSYSGGANLQLYETSGRLLSDGNEKVPAFSEILVVRTNEVQAGSNIAGMGGGGGVGGATKEKTAGALGTINAAKKQAQEVSIMNRRSELEFGAELTQTHQQKMMMATSITNSNNNNNNNRSNYNNSNNLGMMEKSEEEKLQELQDIVGRDMGVGSSTYGGRGNNNMPYNRGNQQQQQGGPMMMNQQQGGFAAGKSIAAGGQAMAAAPSANYVCHICGEKGHFITHCPKANVGRGNVAGGAPGGRPGGNQHQRRFAQPTGIPESELERCSPEEAMFITRDGQYVRRKMVGLGNTILSDLDTTMSGKAEVVDAPILKCMHCNKIYNDIKHLQKLPCNCATGRIACTKCVDDGVCLEMSDDGPVCGKCGKEIDADEIVPAKLEDLPKSGQRRERQ